LAEPRSAVKVEEHSRGGYTLLKHLDLFLGAEHDERVLAADVHYVLVPPSDDGGLAATPTDVMVWDRGLAPETVSWGQLLSKLHPTLRIVGMLARIRRRLGTDANEETTRWASDGRKASAKGFPAFFVVGEPKSGTGWLTKILDSHPEVLCKAKGVFFGRRHRRERLKSTGGRMPPASLQNAILEDEYLRLWVERSGWTEDDDPERCLTELARLAVDYFMGKELARSGKRMAGDKTPFFAKDILSEMSAIYPEARVIHIIRDGRDVVVSKMHHLWRASPRKLLPEEVAKRDAFYEDPRGFSASHDGIFREERLRDWAEGWRTRVGRAVKVGPTLFGTSYVEVRYEDLLQRPEEQAQRLFRFLGAEASAEVVAQCVEEASFEKGSGRQRGQDDYPLRHGKYRKGIAGDWKNVFTERDREIFKEAAGDLLIELGYENDDAW
jgi:hypothetical protein